jgi:hypothetical protein
MPAQVGGGRLGHRVVARGVENLVFARRVVLVAVLGRRPGVDDAARPRATGGVE